MYWLFHGESARRPGGAVQVKALGSGYQLYRNGKPYVVKGASVVDMDMLRAIKAAGGNSIRLYDTHNAGPILDSAHKLGLTVTLGLKLKQARREMDYGDDAAVALQFAELKKEVLRYKDHPALLMWAIGNETTLFIPHYYRNFFALRKVFRAVDAVARMIHQVDGNHPTTIVLANVNKPLIQMATLVCHDIDLLSFNVFGRLKEVLPKVAYSGWKGPYLITEFGAKGYWGAPRTEWHSRVEPTSYHKAQYLQEQYQALAASGSHCLGSYVFLWGAKQEYTATWFSLFAPWAGMRPTELSDACAQAWTGSKPAGDVPSINYLLVDGRADEQNIYLQPDSAALLELHTLAPQRSELRLRWEIHEENPEYLNSSYKKHNPRVLADSIIRLAPGGPVDSAGGSVYRLRFNTPTYEGPFRLYVYLMEPKGKVAVANASIFVHAR